MRTYDVNKVTPRPWDADRLEVVYRAPHLSASVATTYNLYEADAAHIVHCVNMHEELVEALEGLAEQKTAQELADLGYEGCDFEDAYDRMICKVRAVLARARGEQ